MKRIVSLTLFMFIVGIFYVPFFGWDMIYDAVGADGSGTNTLSPSASAVSKTGRTFTFTFTAAEQMDSGKVTVTIPSGWSEPQGSVGTAGNTRVIAGSNAAIADPTSELTMEATTGWTDPMIEDACNTTDNPALDASVIKQGSNAIKCDNSSSTIPGTGAAWGYVYGANQDWSSYETFGVWFRSSTAISGTGSVAIKFYSNSGLSTMVTGGSFDVYTLNGSATLNADTWYFLSGSLTGVTRTAVRSWGLESLSSTAMDNSVMYLDDFLLGHTDIQTPTFSGSGPWTITVRLLDFDNTETFTLTYGYGGGSSGVTVSSSAATHTFTTQSQVGPSGSLTSISSQPTVIVSASTQGSYYSQDHANTDGSLYIGGVYSVPSSGVDYWNYAKDFDGTDLTGSERRVNVRLASSASVTVPSGSTLQILGGSGGSQSTTLDWQSAGGYTMTVAGTINAQYYTMDHLKGAGGLSLASGATVTSISNGTFDNLVGTGAVDDAFITVDGSLIGSGEPSKTVASLTLANTGSGAECNIRATGSAQTGYWNFTPSAGAFAGENNDCDLSTEIRWGGTTYRTSGYFISSTFDTQRTNGAAYNTFVWKGSKPTNTNVKLQLATSSSSTGPWTYYGSDCTTETFYTPAADTAVEIKCYTTHNNKRYFKYKVTLTTSDTSVTPQVDDVVVNYSQ